MGCHFLLQHYRQIFYHLSHQESLLKNLPANSGDTVSIPMSRRSPGGGMATHSSILAWRIPWTEEPGGLRSIGSQKVGHNGSDLACMHMIKNTDEEIQTAGLGVGVCHPPGLWMCLPIWKLSESTVTGILRRLALQIHCYWNFMVTSSHRH